MPDPDLKPETIFISFNRLDRAWATWIAWHVEEAGHKVIFQDWDFLPGQNFVDRMDDAVRRSDRTIAVLSPTFLTSRFTRPEWQAAFARDPDGKLGMLIPVRVAECDVDGLLGQIVYLDLVGHPEADAREMLTKRLRGGRLKPWTAPAFPGAAPAPEKPSPAFPSARPDHWTIPGHHYYFTGRQDVLDKLSEALAKRRRAALVGMSGQGKTITAREFAHRNRAAYRFGFWANAASPDELLTSYDRIARSLGLFVDEKDAKVAADSVMRWANDRPGWLLVLDNADDFEAVADLVPPEGDGHLLLTSRHPIPRSHAEPVELRPMPDQEAARLLLVRGRRIGLEDGLDRASEVERTAALELAGLLGGLPLAIDQAGA